MSLFLQIAHTKYPNNIFYGYCFLLKYAHYLPINAFIILIYHIWTSFNNIPKKKKKLFSIFFFFHFTKKKKFKYHFFTKSKK